MAHGASNSRTASNLSKLQKLPMAPSCWSQQKRPSLAAPPPLHPLCFVLLKAREKSWTFWKETCFWSTALLSETSGYSCRQATQVERRENYCCGGGGGGGAKSHAYNGVRFQFQTASLRDRLFTKQHFPP